MFLDAATYIKGYVRPSVGWLNHFSKNGESDWKELGNHPRWFLPGRIVVQCSSRTYVKRANRNLKKRDSSTTERGREEICDERRGERNASSLGKSQQHSQNEELWTKHFFKINQDYELGKENRVLFRGNIMVQFQPIFFSRNLWGLEPREISLQSEALYDKI